MVNYLDSIVEAGEEPKLQEFDPDLDAVSLLTVHAAKGLEFKVVFIVSLTHDRFPSISRNESLTLPKQFIKETLPKGNYHLQEERRLFYVAMTRAQKKLFLALPTIAAG